MKRGLISRDQAHLPEAVFEERLSALHRLIADRGVHALVAFSDVWRSNDVRYVSNYMPYWNRALTVVPPGGKPILLCALSPRVYPWIKTVTIHETIIPSPNLGVQLVKLAAEKGWTRLGIVDHAGLPHDLYMQLAAEKLEIVDIPRSVVRPAPSAAEIAMHRQAAQLARTALEVEMGNGAMGLTDHEFTGRLERRLRRDGAEDLFVWVSNGRTPPVPAAGNVMTERSSAMVALECNGHWAKVSRNVAGVTSPVPPEPGATVHLESLSAASGWEGMADRSATAPAIVALQVEVAKDGARLYYGDTCVQGHGSVAVL